MRPSTPLRALMDGTTIADAKDNWIADAANPEATQFLIHAANMHPKLVEFVRHIVRHYETIGMCGCGNKCEDAFTPFERAMVDGARALLAEMKENGNAIAQ